VTSVWRNNFFGTSDEDKFNTGNKITCGGPRFSITRMYHVTEL